MLISKCPECGTRLGWTVVRSFCRRKCGAYLRAAPQSPVPLEFIDGATLMAKLLDPRMETYGNAAETLPAALRGINRGTLFEIGWQTAIAIFLAQRLPANAANWPDEDKLRSLDLARRLLADWPASAERAFPSLPSAERRRRAVTDLSALTRSGRVRDDVGAGIRAIFPERSVGTRIASAGRLHGANLSGNERRARRAAYDTPAGSGSIVGDVVATSVSMNQACHILGKAIGDTSRMLGAMESIDTLGTHKRRVRWPRVEVVRIADLLLHREPIDAFSRRSDIPHYGIEQMICL